MGTCSAQDESPLRFQLQKKRILKAEIVQNCSCGRRLVHRRLTHSLCLDAILMRLPKNASDFVTDALEKSCQNSISQDSSRRLFKTFQNYVCSMRLGYIRRLTSNPCSDVIPLCLARRTSRLSGLFCSRYSIQF